MFPKCPVIPSTSSSLKLKKSHRTTHCFFHLFPFLAPKHMQSQRLLFYAAFFIRALRARQCWYAVLVYSAIAKVNGTAKVASATGFKGPEDSIKEG